MKTLALVLLFALAVVAVSPTVAPAPAYADESGGEE